MGLKQDIIVRSEFSVPDGKGGGSRGGTPGDYVTRYMARPLAVETLAPIRSRQVEDYIVRYMARDEAVEVAESEPQLMGRMRAARGQGGVAFGYGQLSLSHEGLRAASRDLQRLFDEGHTVMKTILSFDEEYLRKHGIIASDFHMEKAGDYRGHIDQMKLRMAIMHGLDRMGHEYDDLRSLCVIQVDTEHVHCHLAMVDAGEGKRAVDGTQKGKISQRGMSLLRRGIDAWLDEKQAVRHMASAVGYERRNVVSYVKRWAHDQMLKESTAQFLLACLPEDKSLWRAGTNRSEMRKPNAIVRSMVMGVLEREDSPLAQSMAAVQAYADQRREAEDLSRDEWRMLVENGRERVIERCVNGVYGMLKALPEDALEVRTPMLDVMSMDYEQLLAHRDAGRDDQQTKAAEGDDLIEFGVRLRSYSTRKNHHKEQRGHYHDQLVSFDAARAAGVVVPDAMVLRDLYAEEEEYHAMCMAKYQKFLNFSQATDEWEKRWDDVATYGDQMISMEMMSRDKNLSRLKDPDEAERQGREIYGLYGAHLLVEGSTGRDVLRGRAAHMRQQYEDKVETLRAELAAHGLRMSIDGEADDLHAAGVIESGPEFDFEDVKALDLHHMRYDFGSDVSVGPRSTAIFVERARERQRLVDAASDYLRASGQAAAMSSLPVDDVREMNAMADLLEAEDEPVLPSAVAEAMRQKEMRRRMATVRLDRQLTGQVERAMEASAREAVDQLEQEVERSSDQRGGEGIV